MIDGVKGAQCAYYGGKVNENIDKLWKNQKNKTDYTEAKEQIAKEENKTDESGKEKKEEVAENYIKFRSSSDLIRKYIEEQRETVKDRIEKGQEGPAIQIGKSEFTQKEWEKLLGKVDEELDAIKERIKKEIVEAEKKKKEEKLREKKKQAEYEELQLIEEKLLEKLEKEQIKLS